MLLVELCSVKVLVVESLGGNVFSLSDSGGDLVRFSDGLSGESGVGAFSSTLLRGRDNESLLLQKGKDGREEGISMRSEREEEGGSDEWTDSVNLVDVGGLSELLLPTGGSSREGSSRSGGERASSSLQKKKKRNKGSKSVRAMGRRRRRSEARKEGKRGRRRRAPMLLQPPPPVSRLTDSLDEVAPSFSLPVTSKRTHLLKGGPNDGALKSRGGREGPHLLGGRSVEERAGTPEGLESGEMNVGHRKKTSDRWEAGGGKGVVVVERARAKEPPSRTGRLIRDYPIRLFTVSLFSRA